MRRLTKEMYQQLYDTVERVLEESPEILAVIKKAESLGIDLGFDWDIVIDHIVEKPKQKEEQRLVLDNRPISGLFKDKGDIKFLHSCGASLEDDTLAPR